MFLGGETVHCLMDSSRDQRKFIQMNVGLIPCDTEWHRKGKNGGTLSNMSEEILASFFFSAAGAGGYAPSTPLLVMLQFAGEERKLESCLFQLYKVLLTSHCQKSSCNPGVGIPWDLHYRAWPQLGSRSGPAT